MYGCFIKIIEGWFRSHNLNVKERRLLPLLHNIPFEWEVRSQAPTKLVKALSSTTSWLLGIQSWWSALPLASWVWFFADLWLLPHDIETIVRILDKLVSSREDDMFLTSMASFPTHRATERELLCLLKWRLISVKTALILLVWWSNGRNVAGFLTGKPQRHEASCFLPSFFAFGLSTRHPMLDSVDATTLTFTLIQCKQPLLSRQTNLTGVKGHTQTFYSCKHVLTYPESSPCLSGRAALVIKGAEVGHF